MSSFLDFKHRQVVPLWRGFVETMQKGELAPFQGTPGPQYTDEAVAGLVHDWKEGPNLAVASDLVSVAWNLGLDTVAIDAARFVLAKKDTPTAARSIAGLYLQNAGVTFEYPQDDDLPMAVSEAIEGGLPLQTRTFYAQIRETKIKLTAYPRNPILWTNLSRLYTTLGVQPKAADAMRVALTLAPENRFVIRAASRLYLHQKEGDRAFQLLTRSGFLRHDPWILSAEIATADAIKKTSRHIKNARRMVEVGRFSPFHLSELASALGTLDAKAGNRKVSRRLVEFSLQKPAENAIAQANWLSRNVDFIPDSGVTHSESAEANAYSAIRSERWVVALRATINWMTSQPFSSRPARIGTYVASEVLQKYDIAIQMGELALKSNPDDHTLRNNLAFAFASRGQQGDLMRAQEELMKMIPLTRDIEDRTFMAATQGLIAYRSGSLELGRRLYDNAISFSEKTQNLTHEALARVHLALEALRAQEVDAEKLRSVAIAKASKLSEAWFKVLVERLEKYRAV